MASKSKKKLKVIVIAAKDLIPPDRPETLSEEEILEFKNEYDVINTLQKAGHDVKAVGVENEIRVIRNSIEAIKPDVAFNLLVEFRGSTLFEPYVVSYLELLQQPYTGCNPRGLMLAQDKALTKKILTYHRIAVPSFAVFPKNQRKMRTEGLKYPVFVKSLTEEGSAGISQSSVVKDDQALMERVDFIHKQTGSHAIAEEFIEGREIYVGVIGNRRLQAFTPWELILENPPGNAPLIATSKLKWNRAYQKKVGLITRPAEISPETKRQMEHLSKRIYRILNLSGYARMDYRMTGDGRLYLLEANPNPDISFAEDFAESAKHSGLPYDQLLEKIMQLGIRYQTVG